MLQPGLSHINPKCMEILKRLSPMETCPILLLKPFIFEIRVEPPNSELTQPIFSVPSQVIVKLCWSC